MNLYNNTNSSVVHPVTYGDIIAELQNIELMIKTCLDDPTYFTTLTGGSATITIDQYVAALNKREEMLRDRLNKLPYWVGTEIDTVI